MADQQIPDYEQRFVEALNRGDVSAADDIFAPECTIHITGSLEPITDIEDFKAMLEGTLAAFPDLRFTIEDQFMSGDRVATRWRARGTHKAPFADIPATGQSIDIEGVMIDHVVAGKVVERWEQFDQAGMMRQLGVA